MCCSVHIEHTNIRARGAINAMCWPSLHPSLVRMCKHEGAELLYGNVRIPALAYEQSCSVLLMSLITKHNIVVHKIEKSHVIFRS